MADLRIRIIERICRLPQNQLVSVETLLNQLAQDSPIITVAPNSDWPHAPLHRLSEHGTYMVTAATVNKEHFFRGEPRLTLLERNLLQLAKRYGIQLEAWAVFSNHYHFVGHSGPEKNRLRDLLSHLHTQSAAEINQMDGTAGRSVWFNFWDTQLTFEKSYFARLNYVHHNAVKHGLVPRATDYRWCSAAWFEGVATRAQVQTIYSFKIDRVQVEDDYAPLM